MMVLGFPFIWNMGSSTSGTCFGVVLAVFLSYLRLSFNFFASSLFSCLVSLSFLEFFFSTLLWPPYESDIGGGNICHLPYFPVVWVVGLVWYLVCYCASRNHAPLVWPVCWRAWLALTRFVHCSAAVFLNFLSHYQISLLISPKLRHAVLCLLWVPLIYFGCRLWVILLSSQPWPLGFPLVFEHGLGTACTGLMFYSRPLMGFENSCSVNGPVLSQRTSSPVLLVHRILLFLVDWKWFLLCQVVQMALYWSHAVLRGHGMLITLGALLR